MVRIDELRAPIHDDGALAELLSTIPLPSSVNALLRKPFFGRRWDTAKQRDYWLTSDGGVVVCLEISGASASHIARLRTRFDDLRKKQPGMAPSRKALVELLAAIAREDQRGR